jgi:hypothetical protein
MNEYATCYPSTMPDKNGVFQEDLCKDDRLTFNEQRDLFSSFGTTWVTQCYGDVGVRKRSQIQSPQRRSGVDAGAIQKRFAGQLIKSRDLGQSAVEVCTSKSSIGPNFYSYLEGQFCDMEKRRLYRRCDASDETECFDE